MIAFVEGKCVYASKNRVALEVNGIGYDILVTERFAEHCVIDKQYRLQTILIVRDSELMLVGFAQALEREFFKLLTTISGVGPKLAMKILSDLSPSEIAGCVLEEKSDVLKQVSGVGAKTAKRIVLELQEKISALAEEIAFGSGDSRAKRCSDKEDKALDKIIAEAEGVLTSLGCLPEEAEAAVQAALSRYEPGNEPASSDLLVMAAMSEMGGE